MPVWVVSTRREPGRGAYQAAVEESLEGSREDGPPCLGPGQLLRTFRQAAQEDGDGFERAGDGLRLGV